MVQYHSEDNDTDLVRIEDTVITTRIPQVPLLHALEIRGLLNDTNDYKYSGISIISPVEISASK